MSHSESGILGRDGWDWHYALCLQRGTQPKQPKTAPIPNVIRAGPLKAIAKVPQ
jgi:hypothetical protein